MGFFSFPAIYGTIVLIHTYIVEVWRERYERYAPFSLYLSLLLLVLLNKSEAKNQQIIALKSLATIKIHSTTATSNIGSTSIYIVSLVSSLDGNSIKQQYE